MKDVFVHPTAVVSEGVSIGKGTSIWHFTHVRERVRIGTQCILGQGVYLDAGVVVGDNVKIQNGACVYFASILADGVFLGPRVILTNDRYPRAETPGGRLKRSSDWKPGRIVILRGASLGAGVVVLPGVCVGTYAMIGAGSVVTGDVPAHGLVVGTPGRVIGSVCYCGQTLRKVPSVSSPDSFFCDSCLKRRNS